MPMIDTNGTKINVEISGRDDAPVLMLSNSLGTNLHMWDEQAAEWAKHFRVVRYDRRGVLSRDLDVNFGPVGIDQWHWRLRFFLNCAIPYASKRKPPTHLRGCCEV